jgi:endo-1,4-beta-xylanase
MKWYSTDPNGPTFDYSQPDAMLAWCNANNIIVRGHNIFWDIEEVQQVSLLALMSVET